MFNVKISLLYLLLITLCFSAIMVIVGEQKEEAVKSGQAQLQALPALFGTHKELREKRLEEFARRLGTSELSARMRSLYEFRKKFIDVDKYICSDETGVKCDMQNPAFSQERSRLAASEFGETIFKEFSDQLTKLTRPYHPKWSPEDAKGFQEESVKTLGECFGRGSTQCDWRFTFDGLDTVMDELREAVGGDERRVPDLVLVFDGQGVGIASHRLDRWSYERKYIDLVVRLRQFVLSRDTKGVSPVYFDLLNFKEISEQEYVVAMVPVTGKNDEFYGAILVAEAVDGDMVSADKELVSAEVTYATDRALASSLERGQFTPLLGGAKVKNRLKKHIVSSEDWVAISFPYYTSIQAPKEGKQSVPTFVNGVAYGSGYQDLRVILAMPRKVWEAGFDQLQLYVPVFGFVLFIVGVILFFLLIRNHTRPFEKIDTGLHEVINGNFDYQFPFDYTEELPRVMAQSLNLMIAVLLGKELPEDDEAALKQSGGWDMGGTASSSAKQGPKAGEVIIEPQPDGKPAPPDLLREPAETYYKRLYADYKAALGGAEGSESITYVRFVEQLVRGERDLKEKLDCKHVRFMVNTRGNQVVLTPVPIA